MPRGIGVAFVLAVIGALVLTPAGAMAKKKKKPKSPPVTVASNTQSTSANGQTLTLTASCPAGKIAVGGGFDSPPVIVGGLLQDLNLAFESRRASNTTWQVTALRLDGPPTGNSVPITASVDCRTPNLGTKKKAKKTAAASKKKKKRKLQVTEVSASQTASVGGSAADATASCPPNTQAIAGGFTQSPQPTISSLGFMWASYRSGATAWRSALTTGSGPPRTVTSYGYCAAGLKVAEVSASASLGPSGPGYVTGTAKTSPCTKGRALLSGGFNNTPIGAGGHIAVITQSGSVGAGWQEDAVNFSTIPGQLGSFGYCA